MTGGENVDGVRGFFDQWHLYKKVAACNYLHHREACAALAGALDRFDRPFRFLDLGAGDGAWTAQVLAGRPVCRYDAVDLSPVALELAGKNFANIECEKSFTQGDFVEALKAGMSAYDVIYIGLSLHHLLRGAKEEFLPIVRRHLTDGGSFICYEPINEPGESRDEVMKRWWKVVVRDWVELTPDERDAVQDHVFGNDYPESLRDYAALAEKAGFSRSLVRYCDPDALYAVMEFTNEPSVTAA